MKVVIWSGGADSTLLLAQALATAMPRDRIAALTLRHPKLHPPMVRAERVARENFKRWARKKGWSFQHHTVTVAEPHLTAPDGTGQYSLWASHLVIAAGSISHNHLLGDAVADVEFGYIKRDDFWHIADRFVSAFNALAYLSQFRIKPTFPLEWYSKQLVINELHRYGVPRSSWFSCQEPTKTGKACRTCVKCADVVGLKPAVPEDQKRAITISKLQASTVKAS